MERGPDYTPRGAEAITNYPARSVSWRTAARKSGRGDDHSSGTCPNASARGHTIRARPAPAFAPFFCPLPGGFGHVADSASVRFARRQPESFDPRDFRRETSHDVVHGSTADTIGVRSPGCRARSGVVALSDGPAASPVPCGGMRPPRRLTTTRSPAGGQGRPLSPATLEKKRKRKGGKKRGKKRKEKRERVESRGGAVV